MSSSPPDGYSARAARADEAAAVTDLIVAADLDVQGWSEVRPADMETYWRMIGDLDHNTWAATDDGALVAYGDLLPHGDVAETDGYVHPAHTGRGLGAWLRERMEERARGLGFKRVHSFCLAPDTRARALFESRGMEEVRRYYRMVIDLDQPPEPPELPAGIRIAPYRDEDARAFHAAITEAFADEWNFVPMSFEDWVEQRINASDTDTRLWFIAWDGDEIAGVNRCDPSRFGMGWVGALGVRSAWRGRGIGLALLQHSFVEFHRRGENRVGLGVDAYNPTGATRLYERAGMRVAYESVSFAKELA